MHHFDKMLRAHVAPALRSAGYTGRGRTFRLIAESGDQAIVRLHRSGGQGDQVEFSVDLGVVTVPYWDWLGEVFPRAPDRAPSDTDGLWRGRLHAPAGMRADARPWTRNLWLLDGPDAVDTCGQKLAELLLSEAVPLLATLLDRAAFLALSRDPAGPLGSDVGPATLMLLVDAGRSPALEAEISRYEALDRAAYPYARRLAAWARNRLSTA